MNEFNDKVALVTGAARRLGRCIAMALAGRGAHIAVHCGHSIDDARKTADDIRRPGVRVEVFRADLAEPEQIDELFEQVKSTFGRVDMLVNNAGVFPRTPLEELTAEQWDEAMAINARAAALCISRAAAIMPDGGAVVNIAGVGGLRPWPGYTAYCASKAAVVAVAKSTAGALAARNIRVNAVAPGMIRFPDEHFTQSQNNTVAKSPMRRAGRPEDIAEAVAFMLAQDYITGQCICVDGGWSIA